MGGKRTSASPFSNAFSEFSRASRGPKRPRSRFCTTVRVAFSMITEPLMMRTSTERKRAIAEQFLPTLAGKAEATIERLAAP